jgi:hypothetical protein
MVSRKRKQRLDVEFDWLSPEGAAGPELRATWASLEIHVEGHPVTRVVDTEAKGVRDFVFVPLYPLAEWLALNWWFLFYEQESSARLADPAFVRRHSFRFAGEGFALPALELVSLGDHVSVRWRPSRGPRRKTPSAVHGRWHCQADASRRRAASYPLHQRSRAPTGRLRCYWYAPPGRVAIHHECG